MSFIYLLSDPVIPNKGYVGKSNNPERRLQGHIRFALRNGHTRTPRWIKSLLEKDQFPNILILEECDDWKEAECRWIIDLKEQGWDLTNHTDGGEGVCNPDEEARLNISNAAKKKWADEDIANNIKKSWILNGRNEAVSKALIEYRSRNKNHNDKLPQNTKGFKHSEEFKNKISKATTKNNLKRAANGGYGPLSEEHKRKIGEAQVGKTKIRTKPNTKEQNEAISRATKGKPKSEEWKLKASEAAKRRWENVRLSKQKTEKEIENE